MIEVLYWLGVAGTLGVLVWGSVRTRNPGFLLLALAFPIWSILHRLFAGFVNGQIERVLEGAKPVFPFSLFDHSSPAKFFHAYNRAMAFGQMVLVMAAGLVLILRRRTAEVPTTAEPIEVVDQT